MTNTTTTNTASFTQLSDGSWGIQGFNLVTGEPVVIVKRNGERKEAVVGQIVTPVNRWGKTVARIAQPAAARATETASRVTEPGFYLHDGEAYKVIASRDGSFLYARLVTGRGLKKAPGVFNRLVPAEKMTAEQMAAYGIRTRVCVNCSTTLTDPASQRVGLGTKCGPDVLGKDVYRAAYKEAKAAAEAAQVAADANARVDAEIDAVEAVEAYKADPGNQAEAELVFVAEAISYEDAMIASELAAERRAVEGGLI